MKKLQYLIIITSIFLASCTSIPEDLYYFDNWEDDKVMLQAELSEDDYKFIYSWIYILTESETTKNEIIEGKSYKELFKMFNEDRKNNCFKKNISCKDEVKIGIYATLDKQRSYRGKPPLNRDKITIRNISCSCYENPYYGEINRENETKYRISCHMNLKVDDLVIKYYSIYAVFNDDCEPITSRWHERE